MDNNRHDLSQAKDFMVSTVDNPYNPLTQYDLWKQEDERLGYYTTELMARLAPISHSLSDEQNCFIILCAFFDALEINDKLCLVFEE